MPDWEALEQSSLPRRLLVDGPIRGVLGQKILLILHAYNLDGLASFLSSLRQKAFFHDQVITTDSEEKAKKIKAIHADTMASDCKLLVKVFPNRGRDVLPFWRVLDECGSSYDFFLKVHLKRSKHWEDLGYVERSGTDQDAGTQWSEDIFCCLIPSSSEECNALLAQMACLELGALFPRPHKVVSRFGWGDEQNLIIASIILQELGIDQAKLLAPLIFPAGNMFWGSTKSFLPFTPFFLQEGRYPDEPIPIDGTFLHAAERCSPYLLASNDTDVGILFPPTLESEPSRACLRLLPVDLTRYAGNKEVLDSSPAHLVHQKYTDALVEYREDLRRMRKELEALRLQIQFMNQSRLMKLFRFFRVR
ncbi:rhamnan synthesis F family protein [Cyanobium gracile]|nr:rhamnan synthesis F family protein [Cyanobium gracile]